MKRQLWIILLCASALTAIVVAKKKNLMGWQREQLLFGAVQKEHEGSCAHFPNTRATICVFEAGVPELDLYEVRSVDGGVAWSARQQVTNDTGDEYDAFLAADPARGGIWLLYSKNAAPGNDLMIRYKACACCDWSLPVTMLADGGNHWDASLLVLQNGQLLALETVEAYEGDPEGRIRSIRSATGGKTWEAPMVIFDEPGPETYPVALQKPNGAIQLLFRDKNHGGVMQVGQLWSYDDGHTWTGHALFAQSHYEQQFTFIGSQGGKNVTVLAMIHKNKKYRVHAWESWDDGITWRGPNAITMLREPTNDAEFTMDCRGIIFTFRAPRGFYARRYDKRSDCR